jgi:flagellar hook protein FlgE
MSIAMNIALTGLRAFDKKLDVTANNVANIHTDGFKKSRADMQEAYPDGVKVSITHVNTPGMLLPKDTEGNSPGDTASAESSNVDFATELTDLITTPYHYEANLKVIQAEEEMTGELLNVKA